MTTETRDYLAAQLTRDYCDLIATEVIALESILSGEADIEWARSCGHCDAPPDWCEGERDHDDPHTYRPTDGEVLEMYQQLAENADKTPELYSPNIIDYLNYYCLEFKTLGEQSNDGEWAGKYWIELPRDKCTGCKILRTFGGPNCWIEWDGGNSILVDTYWGADHADRRIQAPGIISALEDLSET